jgi:protein-disulfide isomerase/sulfite exporter TauE/SafE/copper chaperone CopZ
MANKHDGHQSNSLRVKVQGMHCPNCEVLIERRFKKIPGVGRVDANHVTGMVHIVHYGALNVGTLQSAISDEEYTVTQLPQKDSISEAKNTSRDFVEIGGVFVILVGFYLVLKQFDILPDRLTVPSTISYGLALVIGLVASISSCIAVTGGLLLAVAAKYNTANPGLTGVQRFKPHIYFNAGRIASYAILGGAIGALGSTFTLSAETNGLLIILASVIMIVLGLQMLNLFSSLKRLQPTMPKFIAHRIHALSEKETKGGALILGASTFFLPCGFTQALQLYVLAKGSVTIGALTMLAFSIGTLPALMSLSAVSSFASGTFQRYFLKFAGVAVVILGLFNIQSGLTLTATAVGTSTPSATSSEAPGESATQFVPVVDGKQIVEMKIVGYRYEPHQFNVVQGVPVEWRIDAREAAGCGRILLAPKAGVRKLLPSGPTLITFTPQELGEIRFNCGMGMMTRGSKITVLAPPTDKVADAAIPAKAASTAAPGFSPGQRGSIEQITKEYLLQHPEVIQEALAALESRQQADEAQAHAGAVKDNAATLFGSPRQVVLGNPHGDVTMVEFFDYNCAYCKRALSDMLELMKNDGRLKVVLKEFPVLGEPSAEAAQVAVAVRMQDDTGQKYLEFHQKLLGSRGQADRARALAVAKEVGLDMDRLERDMASPEVKATIDENLKLGDTVGITGTPTYVIGSEVVTGAVGLDALREKVRAAHNKSNG